MRRRSVLKRQGLIKKAAMVVAAVILAQTLTWWGWGRHSLEEEVVRDVVTSFVRYSAEKVPSEERPDYLFVCPSNLRDDGWPETVSWIKDQLSTVSVGLMTSEDLRVDGRLPIDDSTVSSVCVEATKQYLFVGIVETWDGGVSSSVGYSYLRQEVYLFFLGGWFKLGPYDEGSIL